MGLIVPENKKEYYLSHYPIDLGYESAKRRNFHGHIHEKTVDKESCLNVGIDSPEVGDRPLVNRLNGEKPLPFSKRNSVIL